MQQQGRVRLLYRERKAKVAIDWSSLDALVASACRSFRAPVPAGAAALEAYAIEYYDRDDSEYYEALDIGDIPRDSPGLELRLVPREA